MKEAVEKFKSLLTDQGAEIVNEEDWGLRKLAYPIDKKTTGFYNFLEFNADPSVIEKLEVNFRRDERVIRFLTVKQDKFALEYAQKRRNHKGGKRHEAHAAGETAKTVRKEKAEAVEAEVELKEKED